jgi:hypothetical protein
MIHHRVWTRRPYRGDWLLSPPRRWVVLSRRTSLARQGEEEKEDNGDCNAATTKSVDASHCGVDVVAATSVDHATQEGTQGPNDTHQDCTATLSSRQIRLSNGSRTI